RAGSGPWAYGLAYLADHPEILIFLGSGADGPHIADTLDLEIEGLARRNGQRRNEAACDDDLAGRERLAARGGEVGNPCECAHGIVGFAAVFPQARRQVAREAIELAARGHIRGRAEHDAGIPGVVADER